MLPATKTLPDFLQISQKSIVAFARSILTASLRPSHATTWSRRATGRIGCCSSRPERESGLHSLALVLRFRASNHIDASLNLVLRSAEAQTSLRSLRKLDCGARVSKDGHKRDRASGHSSSLLRMRSVGLSSIHSIRLVSWNRSTNQEQRMKLPRRRFLGLAAGVAAFPA